MNQFKPIPQGHVSLLSMNKTLELIRDMSHLQRTFDGFIKGEMAAAALVQLTYDLHAGFARYQFLLPPPDPTPPVPEPEPIAPPPSPDWGVSLSAPLETLLASLDSATVTLTTTLREGLDAIVLAIRDLERPS